MTETTSRIAAVLGLLALSVVSQRASADDGGQPSHIILPDTPAPPGPMQAMPLLHPGLQLTFYMSVCTLPGNVEQVIRATPGTIFDPNSGWTVYTKDRQFTGTAGPLEITIAALENGKVVIAGEPFNSYLPTLAADSPPASAGHDSSMQDVSANDLVSGQWLEPAQLNQLFNAPPGGCTAVRGPWKDGDHTFDALIFSCQTPTVQYQSVYDAQSGLLIHRAVVSQGPPPQVVLPGQEPRGDVLLRFMDLMAVRDLKVPWAGEPMPNWVANTSVMHYQGSHSQSSATGALPSLPIGLDLTFVEHGDTWVHTVKTGSVAGRPTANKTDQMWGIAQFGGLWAGPAELANLQNGQVLDDDPVTQSQTRVIYVDNQSVAIGEGNVTGETDWRYDKNSGMLIGMRVIGRSQLPTPITTVDQVRLTGRQ